MEPERPRTPFDDDLDAQLENLATDPEFFDVEVTVNSKLRALRFWQMDGLEWAKLAALCPVDLLSPYDRSYGYNLQAMTLLAAPASGKMHDGEDFVDLDADQWRKLLQGLSGAGHRHIANALFALNEHLPSQAVIAAKKASRAESALKSNSPDPLAHPAAGSSEESLGSEPSTPTTMTDDSPAV